MDPKWYYYFNKKGEENLIDQEKGIENTNLLEKTKHLESDNLLICQELNFRKYALFKNFAEFSKFYHKTPEEERCFYEMLKIDSPRKPYFDIDLDSSKDFDIVNFVEVIKRFLGKKIKILVFTSHTEKKKSFHVVVDNVYFETLEEIRYFYDKISEEVDINQRSFLDKSVYKSVQQFRIIGSHKYYKKNTKVLQESLSYNYKIPKRFVGKQIPEFNYNLSLSLISNTNYCKPIFGFKRKKEVNTSLTQQGVATEEDVTKVLDAFFDKYDKARVDFKFLECKENNGNLLIVLRRLTPTFCEICERIHENENPFLICVGQYKQIYFYCRRKEKSNTWIKDLIPRPETPLRDQSNDSFSLRESSISPMTGIESDSEELSDSIENELESMSEILSEEKKIFNKKKSKTPVRISKNTKLLPSLSNKKRYD